MNSMIPLALVLALLGACHNEQQVNHQLLAAAEQGDLLQVDEMLELGGDANARDFCAITPLMRASMQGNVEMVERLLSGGALLNLADKSGYSALMQAAGNNRVEIVELLLQRGADIDQAETERGWTPLIWAAKRGHTGMVALLLKKGADKHIVDKQQMDAHARAIKAGHEHTAKLLK